MDDSFAHLHVHTESERAASMTPWILFAIFVFGPCEPLIPVLMYPAALQSVAGVLLVTSVFAVVTLATMLGVVLLAVIVVVGLWAAGVFGGGETDTDSIAVLDTGSETETQSEAPTDTLWIRDFGPVLVRRGDGTHLALDFEYRRRSGSRDAGMACLVQTMVPATSGPVVAAADWPAGRSAPVRGSARRP